MVFYDYAVTKYHKKPQKQLSVMKGGKGEYEKNKAPIINIIMLMLYIFGVQYSSLFFD